MSGRLRVGCGRGKPAGRVEQIDMRRVQPDRQLLAGHQKMHAFHQPDPALGAVMDVAMSVATSLHEIKEKSSDISAKEIFKSGINIGRDMIGTMSNTLILAYVGGSLGLVMVIYAYSYQMHQILNMYSMAIEIMRGISGTMGIILTVPITSLIMSFLLTRKNK